MDGSGTRTVISLDNAYYVNYAFVFTLDYSQQMLFWVIQNISDTCYYTSYIGSSNIEGTAIRIVHMNNILKRSHSCDLNYRHHSQAIDFFGGSVYSYSSDLDILKIVLDDPPIIVRYDHVSSHMTCHPAYPGMKVISHQRQLQGKGTNISENKNARYILCEKLLCKLHAGFNPCAINNGGCAHICLLSVNNEQNYTCACHSGTHLHQNGLDCIGKSLRVVVRNNH